MNYMEQVAEMLGLEIGDSFLMVGDEDNKVLTLGEKGIECKETSELSCDLFLCGILTGEIEIKKFPWKPKNKEIYFSPCVDIGSAYATENYWRDTYQDKQRYRHHMVCKTINEAVEKAEKILKALEED